MFKRLRRKIHRFRPAVDGIIQVHPETDSPTKVWDKIKQKHTVDVVTPLPLDTPISPDKVRFVCISDTHNVMGVTPSIVPDGDILLHAGDFSHFGSTQDIEEFNEFLGKFCFALYSNT